MDADKGDKIKFIGGTYENLGAFMHAVWSHSGTTSDFFINII